VISSASNDPREYLGQFLMSHGFLTEPELKKAMEVQLQSGILLGKILVMIDVISEKDLTRLMRLKAEEEIYDIFLWREGDFHFIDDQLPTMEMIPLQVDVTGIIMEGTRRFDEWTRIRELIPNETLVPVIEKPVDDEALEDLELGEASRTVVAAVDGRRTIADIILESRSSSFRVSETLASLAREGFIRLTDPTAQRAAMVAAEAQATAASEDDEIAGMLQRAQNALRAKEFEKAQRLLKAAQNLDPGNAKVSAAIKGSETVILAELRNAGLTDSKIPRVAKTFDEITGMNFTPNEGFILSRINGQWDIGSLIKISPIREPDAMLIFYKLWRDEIISLD
jgi:hypothetical protein